RGLHARVARCDRDVAGSEGDDRRPLAETGTMSHPISVLEIALPEYEAAPETDWAAVGRKLDGLIAARFPGRRIAIRGSGLVDHPDKPVDSLAAAILEAGTDRYDPQRRGVHEDYYRHFTIDLFAEPCAVSDGLRSLRKPGRPVMGMIVKLFHEGALA